MNNPISITNKKFKQGLFIPKYPEKFVGNLKRINYKSSWEHKFMIWCDNNPSVIKWGSETFPIHYYSQADQKYRRYYIDFIIEVKKQNNEIETWFVEIKPSSQVKVPRKTNNQKRYLKECYDYQVNCDKWKAAEEFAKKNNCKFIIITEKDLGIKK